LATLDPKYSKDIAFYIVGHGPSQTVEVLEMDRQKQGYTWPVAELTGSGLQDLQVLLQSTKIAIDERGVITYRDGFGGGDLDRWRSALEDLGASRDDPS
jgi:hypothetical protein